MKTGGRWGAGWRRRWLQRRLPHQIERFPYRRLTKWDAFSSEAFYGFQRKWSGCRSCCVTISRLFYFHRGFFFFFPGHLDCQHKSGLRRHRRPWHRLLGLQRRRVKHRQHMWLRHNLKLLIKGVVDLSCESLQAAAAAAVVWKKKKPMWFIIQFSPHAASVQTKALVWLDWRQSDHQPCCFITTVMITGLKVEPRGQFAAYVPIFVNCQWCDSSFTYSLIWH